MQDTISPGGDGSRSAAREACRSYLATFCFRRTRARRYARSGGERNRLLLARLFARPANVLVLDEPTNDLDIEMLELRRRCCRTTAAQCSSEPRSRVPRQRGDGGDRVRRQGAARACRRLPNGRSTRPALRAPGSSQRRRPQPYRKRVARRRVDCRHAEDARLKGRESTDARSRRPAHLQGGARAFSPSRADRDTRSAHRRHSPSPADPALYRTPPWRQRHCASCAGGTELTNAYCAEVLEDRKGSTDNAVS